MDIQEIFERKEPLIYLRKRNLLKQYKKAKDYLLESYFSKVDFKLRQPKEEGTYSFRINKQFRALGILKGNTLIVFEIDNHQN